MVGIGTQDSAALARDFVSRHKMTVTQMYWDQSFAAWRFYGVPGQPAALLLDKEGKVLGGWQVRIAWPTVLKQAGITA